MHPQENLDKDGNLTGNGNELADVNLQDLDFYYTTILQGTQEGIWITNPQGATIYVNRRMSELLGSSAEEMKKKNRLDFVLGEDYETAFRLVQNRSQHIKAFECKYRRADGSEQWTEVTTSPVLDKAGNYLATVAIHTDITDRKIAENALQRSQQGVRVLMDRVRDYAIFSIDKDRHVLTWNTGAKEIFGYSENEIIGQLCDVLFTAEDVANRIPEKEVELALGSGHALDDRWLKRKDGSIFYVSGVLTALNQEGDVERFIKIARDWTEQRKIEEALKNADRHKNEFLATLAHELRNPLASINSGLEVLRKAQDDKSRMQTQERIERQTQLMIHLVNDLLDISRISLGKIKIKKQPLNLIEAINLALETSRPIILGYGHSLTVSLPEEPIVVNGDNTRLSQVFMNILINAAKYTPPGGMITFTASHENNNVIIRVRDNGRGIPLHMLGTIFEMFEQIQDRSEYPQAGLGIGLSVVKQLVQMHDGHVEAYSDGENKGSEFVVRLPLHLNHKLHRQHENVSTESKAPNAAAPVTKRVLIVDDNSDAADMMEILLKKKGFTTRKAYDGRGGICAAVDFNPEIVLLDLGLPDIDGYEVVKTLKEKLGKRLYIALSGWGQEEDLNRSKAAGFDHHLVKPVDFKTIEDLILA